MVNITFVAPGGEWTSIEAVPEKSMMQNAIANRISGIVAECGGNAMCGTCHVYVAESCLDKLPPVNDAEDAMLDFTASPRQQNSRLSCQIPIKEEFGDITVVIPESQL